MDPKDMINTNLAIPSFNKVIIMLILLLFLAFAYSRVICIYKYWYYSKQGVIFPPNYNLIYGHMKFLKEYCQKFGGPLVYKYFEDLHLQKPAKMYGYFHGSTLLLFSGDPTISLKLSQMGLDKSRFTEMQITGVMEKQYTFYDQKRRCAFDRKRKSFKTCLDNWQLGHSNLVKNSLKLLLKRWDLSDGSIKRINMSQELNEVAYNIMVLLTFGDQFVYQEVEYTYKGQKRKGYYGEVFRILTEYLFTRQDFTKNVLCSRLLPYHLTKEERECYIMLQQVQNFFRLMISKCKDNPTEFLKRLITECQEEDLIVDECFGFFFAGAELVGLPLASLLYYLATKQEYLREAKMQIEKLNLPKDPIQFIETMNYNDLLQIDFLRYCIAETIRITTPQPAAFLFWSPNQIQIEGFTILPYENLSILYNLLHNNPNEWQKHSDFLPERFDPQHELYLTPDRKKRNIGSYNPFLPGPRSCPGQLFSERETVMMAAFLIKFLNFNQETAAIEGEQQDVYLDVSKAW